MGFAPVLYHVAKGVCPRGGKVLGNLWEPWRVLGKIREMGVARLPTHLNYPRLNKAKVERN